MCRCRVRGACDIRYWRGRIEELLSAPDVPRHVRKLSEAVLAKIHTMEMRFATMK